MKFALSISTEHNKQKTLLFYTANLNYVGYFSFFTHFHQHNERTNSCRGNNFTIRNANTRSGLIIQPVECVVLARKAITNTLSGQSNKRNKASTAALKVAQSDMKPTTAHSSCNQLLRLRRSPCNNKFNCALSEQASLYSFTLRVRPAVRQNVQLSGTA